MNTALEQLIERRTGMPINYIRNTLLAGLRKQAEVKLGYKVTSVGVPVEAIYVLGISVPVLRYSR
jgi:hypothetical protein